MKKLLIGMAALISSALPAMAATYTSSQSFLNQVVTTTSSFTLDTNASGFDAISFTANVSSANPSSNTFKDGTPSTGAITVVTNSALGVVASSDALTIVTNSALVPTAGSISVLVSTPGGVTGATVTVNGVKLLGGTAFTVGATSNTVALALASAINSNVPNVLAAVSPVAGGTVTITCVQQGSFCNSYTVASSTIAISTAAGTNFTGGYDNPSFNLNGAIFYQGQSWFTDVNYSSNTAVSIANAVNTLGAYAASTQTATSVLIKLATAGSYGNAYTLTSSTSALAVNSATFQAGQDPAYVVINGRKITPTIGTSAAITAQNLQNAINADSVLSSILIATAPSGGSIVYATGTVVTTGSNNYSWYSSTQAALKVTNTGLFGGTTTAYLVNTGLLVLPSHGLATGEAVLLTTGTISITPLVNQTTYYVISVDANDIELSTTNAFALSGQFVTLTSSSTAGPHSFTLAPLALSGTELLTWSVSNDGVNFSTPTVTAANVTIPVNSFASPYTAATYGYDFGQIAYRYLRLTIAGPATAGVGGFNNVIYLNGKQYWR